MKNKLLYLGIWMAISSAHADYKVFATQQKYNGNLKAYGPDNNPSANGIAGADYICNSDSKNPNDGSYYRAMIVDSSNRNMNKDWVLQRNTIYKNERGDIIDVTSNDSATFSFNLKAVLSTTSGYNIWTGLYSSWENDDADCKDWASSSHYTDGAVGRATEISQQSIHNTRHWCDSTRALYCVEQPRTVMPLDRGRPVLPNAPIIVKFNSLNGIKLSTVESRSFTVYQTNKPESVIQPSKIEALGDDEYRFYPEKSLAYNTSYTVKLSDDIKENGNPNGIFKAQFSFNTITTPRMIFETTKAYWGNLGGIHGADEKCNERGRELNFADGSVKALISDGSIRKACDSTGCGGSHSRDWVLEPNTDYLNQNGDIIGRTTESSIFDFSADRLENSMSQFHDKVWTGLYSNWTSGPNCAKWTKGNKSADYTYITGRVGRADADDRFSISSSDSYCFAYVAGVDTTKLDTQALYCVQQQ